MSEHEVRGTAGGAGSEAVALERALAGAPSRRLLDLGCGTGRWARRFGEEGWEVVGIDASESALERARSSPLPDGVELLQGDMGAVERLVRGHFGAAICLGNTLPHLLSPESLSRMLVGLKRRLVPGAPFVVQILDYDRIFERTERALAVEVVDEGDGELAVVRLLRPRDDGIVVHTTSTLRHRPSAQPAIEVVGTRAEQLRGWRREELEVMLDVARFSVREVYGDLEGSPHRPGESWELVMVVG